MEKSLICVRSKIVFAKHIKEGFLVREEFIFYGTMKLKLGLENWVLFKNLFIRVNAPKVGKSQIILIK